MADDTSDDWLVQRNRKRMIMVGIAVSAGAAIAAGLLMFVLDAEGELLEEVTFRPNGELVWEVQAPEIGAAGLWLRCEVDAPSVRDEGDPSYALKGELKVESGGTTRYDGPLTFASQGAAVRGGGTQVSFGTEDCNATGSRCQVNRTVRLNGVVLPQGRPVMVTARMPTAAQDVEVKGCALQLRWRED